MKKLSIIAVVFLSVVFFSCNNGQNNTNGEVDSTKTEEEVVINNENLPFYKVKAQFDIVVANSRGALFIFIDEAGNSFDFFDKDTPQELRDITKGAMPNEHDSKWDNIWFDIEYQKQTVMIVDGATGNEVPTEKLVITSITQIGGETTASNGITFEDINNAKFFGTNGNWLLEFKSGNVFYTGNIGEDTHKAYYMGENKMTKISDNQVQIKFTFDTEKGYISTATITKTPCSDGESDMTHDYSISVKWEDRVDSGCGRAVTN